MEQAEGNHPDGLAEQYGAFALETESPELTFIGGTVDSLNALEPGAGFACARVLQYALKEVDVFDAEKCYSILDRYADYYDEVDEEEESKEEITTMGLFDKEIPEEMYLGKYEVDPIRRLLEKGGEDQGLKRLLEDVLALDAMVQDADAMARDINHQWVFGQSTYCWEDRVSPLVMLYRHGGVEERIFDDYENGLSQGEHTYLSFFHAFDVTNNDSLGRAALALWWVIRVLVLADQVLQGMNWDASRDHRFDDRVRTVQDKKTEYEQRRAEGRTRPPTEE